MTLRRMGCTPPKAASLARRHSSLSGVPTARMPAASWLSAPARRPGLSASGTSSTLPPLSDAQTKAALEEHWRASERGDIEAEHAIYSADAILDYPQSGERFRGRTTRSRTAAARTAHGLRNEDQLVLEPSGKGAVPQRLDLVSCNRTPSSPRR